MIEPLFDNNLIINKSNNIKIIINKPIKKGVALYNDRLYEGDENAFYSIIQKKDKIELFYRALKLPDSNNIAHKYTRQFECTCYAESNNGINFIKPNINSNTNIVFKNNYSHNFFPFYYKNQLLAVGGTQYNTGGLLLLENTIQEINNWCIVKKLIDGSQLIPGWCHDNHFDSFNILFYDPNYSHYKIYMRHNDPKKRQVQYTTTTDFNNFTEFKKINLINYFDHIYYSNFQMYPESKYYIGLPWCTDHFVTMQNEPTMLMFSINGHDWITLDFNIIPEKKSAQTGYGFVLDNLNNKMYIYVFDQELELLEIYYYELHRIQEISCTDLGSIKLGLFDLKQSQEIFANYKTNSDGFIQFELLDEHNNIILTSEKMIGDVYFKQIEWLDSKIIPSDSKYYLNVTLSNASLYSFKM